jgi:hypothetical protein
VHLVPAEVPKNVPTQTASLTTREAYSQDQQPTSEQCSEFHDNIDADVTTLNQPTAKAVSSSQDHSSCIYSLRFTEGPSIAGGAKNRKPLVLSEPFTQRELDEMEHILGRLCGRLGSSLFQFWVRSMIDYVSVIYPTRFLEGEDISNKCVITYRKMNAT